MESKFASVFPERGFYIEYGRGIRGRKGEKREIRQNYTFTLALFVPKTLTTTVSSWSYRITLGNVAK